MAEETETKKSDEKVKSTGYKNRYIYTRCLVLMFNDKQQTLAGPQA